MSIRKFAIQIVLMALLVLVVGTFLTSPAANAADQISQRVWRDVNESSIAQEAARQIIPNRYRTVAADLAALDSLLASAPAENTADRTAGVLLSLPLPDGSSGRFLIQEYAMMEPALAAKFPEITTYLGQGLDDPTATVRLDRTPAGFHGMILSASDTIYIDPYRRGDITNYISYYKRDFDPANKPAMMELMEFDANAASRLPNSSSFLLAPSGSQLRTYRTAVAATGEYTAFFGGTVSAGMAAIVTSMNRVTGVYEREVAVRLVLVANNNLIVYTNAATDPYTNNNGSTMLGQNQTNLDSVIGTANYDVGHVFSTGGGGVASLGVPCRAGLKARGVTGSSQPVGDPYDIDYVAHELGHQFGANHTFNGTTGSCGGGNRNASTAYEPGSASSIMGYAGICGAEDLQPNSDAVFHVASFDEIVAYTTTGQGNTCAAITTTGNTAPTVNAGPDWTIPNQTPFTLTGSATDPNGDALTYSWEQYNLGTASPPSTDNGNRPIFRQFLPVSSPSRTFPKLSDILNNVSTLGESLPTTNRTLTFRLVARDNRAGGGGVNYDTANVTVTTSSGPFVVTAPNTAVSWAGGSSQAVTWNVANTTAAPVSCSAVNILLSTDGGLTFPTSLASSTANDGSESITVPNISTTTARVKVECAGNIFFDISNANFTITGGGPTSTPGPTATATNTPVPPTATNTPGPQTCNTYASSDVPKSISASGTPSVSSVINVASGGTIVDVNVLGLNGTHTYINDLDFNLTSPAGTLLQIMAQSCASQDNFGLSLDDEAAGSPGGWPCPPTGGGTYRPSNALSAFDGQTSTGTWTLRIDDNANQDGGTLTAWSLQICTQGSGPTATNTPVPPTATNTPIPPTATNTPVPPTATATPNCPNLSGTYCRTDNESRSWIAGTTNESITGDDQTKSVTLPFTFNFMATNYTSVIISANGNVHFGTANGAYTNTSLPNTGAPNALIAAMWDDLNPAAGGTIWTTTSGTAPNRTFVIEWRDVRAYNSGTNGATFQIQLVETSNHIWIVYQDSTFGAAASDNGASATSGIENSGGTAGNQYSFNSAVLTSGKVLHFWKP